MKTNQYIFYVQNNYSNEIIKYKKMNLTNIKESEIYKSLLDKYFNKKIKLFFVDYDGSFDDNCLFQFHATELKKNKRLKNSNFHIDYYNKFKTEYDKAIILNPFEFKQINKNVFEW